MRKPLTGAHKAAIGRGLARVQGPTTGYDTGKNKTRKLPAQSADLNTALRRMMTVGTGKDGVMNSTTGMRV